MLDTRVERRLQGTLTGGARSLIEISALPLVVELEDSPVDDGFKWNLSTAYRVMDTGIELYVLQTRIRK
jgi:hypothetical protein